MRVKSFLAEIAKRLITWDKKLEIYKNGEDNAYPERMEAYKNNSITAKMASNVMVQYLIGKGFGEADNLKIGDKKLIDFADELANTLVDNLGYFIHVGYDATFKVADFDVIPFSQCRVGEKDSKEYNGKILVSKKWSDPKFNKDKDVTIYDVFNPNPEIIKYQAEIKEGDDDATIIKKMSQYKGQIIYYNAYPNYYYPLARIDAVWTECDNEYLASTYKNELLRRGFFGKTLVVTRPLVDESFIERASHANATSQDKKNLQDAESEREEFTKTIKEFVGAGNAGGVLHLEIDFKGENLEDAILFKNIESNIDDKLFEFTESSAFKKILMAYNGMHPALIKNDESSLFGNSGESLRVLKETYWENTSKERSKLETQINDLMRLKNDYTGDYLFIKPLIVKEIDQDTALAEKQKAQAVLKGSVGGVTALLEIIASVSNGTTDYNSALAIIKEIYGVSDEVARELLGTPNPTDVSVRGILNRKDNANN